MVKNTVKEIMNGSWSGAFIRGTLKNGHLEATFKLRSERQGNHMNSQKKRISEGDTDAEK